MLSYTDLKKGILFIKDGDPYEVLESSFSRMQQRKAVVQVKIKNLRTGKLYDITLQASDSFEEKHCGQPLLGGLVGVGSGFFVLFSCGTGLFCIPIL